MSDGKVDPVRWYSTVEAAEIIGGCTRHTIVELIQAGYLRSTKLRRQHRIKGAEIARYLTAAERRCAG